MIGRNYSGSWILINPPYFRIQRWISVVSAEVNGDIKQAPFIGHILPRTDASIPPTNVRAERSDDTITVSWDQTHTNMRDERGYLIEATLCQKGYLVTLAVQTDNTSHPFTDEKGCKYPSSAMIYSVDVRGYIAPVNIPWP